MLFNRQRFNSRFILLKNNLVIPVACGRQIQAVLVGYRETRVRQSEHTIISSSISTQLPIASLQSRVIMIRNTQDHNHLQLPGISQSQDLFHTYMPYIYRPGDEGLIDHWFTFKIGCSIVFILRLLDRKFFVSYLVWKKFEFNKKYIYFSIKIN